MKHTLSQYSSPIRKASFGLLGLVVGVSSAFATVQYTSTSFADTYSTVVDSSEVLIPDATGYSALGSFSEDPATLNTGAQLAAAFTAFGSGSFGGANVGGDPGSYSVGGAVTNPNVDPIAGGEAIYLVYGNELTLVGSAQFAVVDSGVVTPINSPDPALATFKIDLPTALTDGSIVWGSMITLVPSAGLGSNIEPGPGSLKFYAVPEPSSAFLALSAFGLLLVRRRR